VEAGYGEIAVLRGENVWEEMTGYGGVPLSALVMNGQGALICRRIRFSETLWQDR
jgi:hypothetical protein